MSLDVGTKCETCLPSVSLETDLNMFVLCYKIKWAKERIVTGSPGVSSQRVLTGGWQSIFKQIPKVFMDLWSHREGIP